MAWSIPRLGKGAVIQSDLVQLKTCLYSKAIKRSSRGEETNIDHVPTMCQPLG